MHQKRGLIIRRDRGNRPRRIFPADLAGQALMGILFEIVFWLNSRIAIFDDIEKAANNLLYFVLGELATYPDDETGYFRHTGLSPSSVQTTFNPILMGETCPFSITF
jgi:hypothetical protein